MRQAIKRFFEPIQNHKWAYIKSILLSFYIFGFDVYTIILLQYITKAIEHKDADLITQYLIIFIISYIVFSFIKYKTRDYSWVTLGRLNETALSEKYFRQLMLSDNTQVEKIGTGRLMAIVNKGVDTWRGTLDAASWFLPEILISVGFVVYSLSQLQPLYGIIFVLIVMLVVGFTKRINKLTLSARALKKEVEILLSRHGVRLMMSKQEILQSNQLDNEIQQYNDEIILNYQYASKTNLYLWWMYEVPIWISQILIIFIMCYVILSIHGGYFEYSLFVGLIGARGYSSKTIIKFTSQFKNFSRDFAHIEKLWSTFDELKPISGYNSGSDYEYKHGDIQLKNIGFSYTDNAPVFSDFSLVIAGGKKIALVGSSGSGKTTLIKLIAGYIKPDKGDVMVDNQNLNDISLQSYYKHVGYLTQEPAVFDGTIRENLMYGAHKAKRLKNEEVKTAMGDVGNGESIIEDGELRRVIDLAQCQFITHLPQGIDTEIGEKGIRLSGGQRQRLAIAKIMLKNPEIILLDEPTSALDSFAEEEVTKALDNLFQGRTVIIIAHRLQTVKHADEIIVLGEAEKTKYAKKAENGMGAMIIERGSHDELLKKGGYYAKMLELQAGF